jgi:hypothetical protein
MLSLTPRGLSPQSRDNRLFTKERRRNVAAVRRRLRISVEVGYRRASPNAGAVAFPAQTHTREKPRRTLFFTPVLRGGKVDKNSGQSLYTFSSARCRLARWRVHEAPHCSHGDRTSGHARGHVRVPASKVRASAPSLWTILCGHILGHRLGHGRHWGRRSCKVPGCLKSESEERETWTAESLRAAFREGKPRAKTVRKRLRRSTF